MTHIFIYTTCVQWIIEKKGEEDQEEDAKHDDKNKKEFTWMLLTTD